VEGSAITGDIGDNLQLSISAYRDKKQSWEVSRDSRDLRKTEHNGGKSVGYERTSTFSPLRSKSWVCHYSIKEK